ncbi:MAG TPA: NAD(P)-dependent alcohol dehydrogenase [Acidimicrobiia bacterium]|nr:NAD(P)-dependent alcohol dehydrogenase [Acidimicrobiia bacterium]
MRAIVQPSYGSPDVLELREVDTPTVGDDDVLVGVRASSVNALDWHLLTGTPYLARLQMGLRRPKRAIPGADVAGRVRAVGQNVTRFQPGDEVFGEVSGGAYAEYVCGTERGLVPKPAGIPFEQAASLPVAGLTAIQGLRDVGEIQSGQRVLINGASGGVGTFSVQIAKFFGAEVTAVCSTSKVDMIRSLGADHVIDYTQEDFTRTGRRYDLIFDGQGNHSIKDYKRVLEPKGSFVLFSGPKRRWLGPLSYIFRAKLGMLGGDQRMGFFIAQSRPDDLEFMGELVESEAVAPVIEAVYPLEGVPEALRYLGEGHARGKLVITL